MDADADRDANSGAATAVGERSSSIQNAEARRWKDFHLRLEVVRLLS